MSAVRQSPRPAATPTADTTQTDAAVVRPSTRRSALETEDHTSADKAHAGDDALDDPAGRGEIRTGSGKHQERAHQRKERRTEGDQRMGSRPRGLLD